MAETKQDESTLAQAVGKGAEKFRSALETALESARSTAESIQAAAKTGETPNGLAVTKGFDFAKQNISAIFGFAQQLVTAGDLKEASKLQSDFVRAQSEIMSRQAEELRGVVSGSSAEVSTPSGSGAAKDQ